MPVYPAHSPGSPRTKARGSPVATRRSLAGGMSGSSRSDSRVADVVTAKRAAKKLVTKKKSTSATSSPKKLAAADPEPAQDPSTPHSPLYRGGSGGSPGSGSPSRFASYASLIETRDSLAESLARSTPDAVATVDAMRQALKDASERLRETDARLTESLTAAAMVRVERDAAEARVDELAAINVALREAARKNEADVAAARVDVQTARNEARDAQAAMVRAKADARRLVDQHKSVADDKMDATRMEVERHRRDAEAAAAEAEASARRADEDAAVRIEDANRRAQETVAVFRRDADAARKEAQRAEESAAQAAADAARRGEEKASIYRRDAEAARAEAKRSKEELEAFRTRCAELERRAESHARLQKEAELARESAAETARRDVADAVAARDVAENRLANAEIALRAAEASRDAKASELAEFVSAREAFEKETRANFETCARARDAAKETALAMERALSAEREASAVRVAEITASRESSRREVAEHKEKARAASALAASVEKKLVLIEADGPARERAAALREETSKARREADALRLKLDLTRDAQNVQTREEVASRAVLEKSLFEARDALGAARLETETTRAELERWQAAVRERDAAIDALGVARLDLEAALESSRLDALEARRAAAAAEGRARAAVVADQKDRPHSGPHDRRDRGFVPVEGEREGGSNGESVFGEKSLFGAAGGAYTVQHPASPAKRGERNFSRDASPFSPRRAGHRGVVSAPSPLRRVGGDAPREAPDAPANGDMGGEDALISAFTRTAPREGW